MSKKYFVLEDENFARALKLLGFNFYRFNDREDGKLVFSFENTELFKDAYEELSKLKKKYKNKGDGLNEYKKYKRRNGSEEL